jgi:hypothetical protein
LRAGRRGSGDGALLSQEAPLEGASRRSPLPRNAKDEVFFRDVQNVLQAGLPIYRGPLGNLEGVRLPGFLREMYSISEYLFEPRGHLGFKSE